MTDAARNTAARPIWACSAGLPHALILLVGVLLVIVLFAGAVLPTSAAAQENGAERAEQRNGSSSNGSSSHSNDNHNNNDRVPNGDLKVDLDKPLPQVIEESRGYALVELERAALAASPRLGQESARVDVARGERLQNTRYPQPEIAYDASALGADGTYGPQGVFVDQPIVIGHRLHAAAAVGDAAIAEQTFRLGVQEMTVVRGVRQLYYELLAAQALVELEEMFVDESRRVLKIAEAKQEVSDEATEPDVRLARSDLRRREARVEAVKSERRGAARQLGVLIRDANSDALRIEGSLGWSLIDGPTDPKDWERWYEATPQIAAARAAAARAQAALAQAKAARAPDVTLRAGPDYDPTVNETTARLRLSVPLDLTWNRGNIAAAAAELRAAALEEERLRMELRALVANQLEIRRRNLHVADKTHEEVLPDAWRGYLDYVERFRKGEASYSSVSTPLETFFERYRERVEALAAARQAEVELSTLLVE